MGENEHRQGMAAYCLDIISSQMERTIKRLWVLCIVLCVLLAASWTGFFIYESQFEYVAETTQEVTQTADGDNHFVGGDYHGYADNQDDY